MTEIYELYPFDEPETEQLSEVFLLIKGKNIRLHYWDHPSIVIDSKLFYDAWDNDKDLHIEIDDGNMKVKPSTTGNGRIVVKGPIKDIMNFLNH
jgi:hypothetical protein